jgi:molybdate transport system substrate-binding protein
MNRRHTIVALAILVCAAGLVSEARADEILVSAAASLTDALNEVGKAYSMANPGTIVRFNFGASGALQQQIAQGAPVDVFASASPREMDALQKMNRIEPDTRADFAGNRLVLIAPMGSALKHWDDLRAPTVRRVAISNPESVPSGRYARETLTKRGLWDTVQPKAIFGETVRQTLTYVSGGNVDAGIVFATDAQTERQRVRVVEQAVAGRDHSPILYPAAVLTMAPNALGARKFTAFLLSTSAQSILARYGFTPANSAHVRKTATPHSTPASAHKPGPRSKSH